MSMPTPDPTRPLPENPSLEFLKKQAKQGLDALRQNNPGAKLADAQVALANGYGFTSWPKLKAHVDKVSRSVPLEEDTQLAELHEAIQADDLARVAGLLDSEPTLINQPAGKTALTPLHVAADKGRLGVVQLLLTRGADPQARATWDDAPLGSALISGHVKTAEFLAQHGWDESDIRYAAGLGRLDLLRQMFTDKGKPRRGIQARMAVELPGPQWTYVKTTKPQQVMDTALESAARNGQCGAIDFLIDHGANPNARGFFGATPLHFAASRGKLDAVRLLLEREADPTLRDPRFDADALGWANEFNQPQVVAFLRDFQRKA